MLILRPIAAADLPALVALVSKAGVGLTTLPGNEAELKKRIDLSLASFDGSADRRDHLFLFALDDTDSGTVVGVCGLVPAVGLRQAWYSYRMGESVHASQELGIFTQTPTLFLSNDHTGHSELCSLFLDPAWRRDRNGALLSKSRFLFIASQRDKFADKIIAELRGVSDAEGRSPFWEGLGRQFFAMDFAHADYLTGIGKKSFVAELMPKHPMYTTFLPPEARDVIGVTHELTRPAQAMLASEGFRFEGHVDIFDAGPVVEAYVDDVGAVRDSRVAPVQITAAPAQGIPHLIANTSFQAYRATLLNLPAQAETIPLAAETARLLGVALGDPVRVVPLSPRDRHPNPKP